MNIAFVNTTKEWGGGEKWHLENAIALHKRGESVVLVCNSGSVLQSRAQQPGIPVYAIKAGRLSFLNIFKILRLILFFKKKCINAILMNGPNDVKLAGVAAKIAGVKKIIYRRGIAVPIKNKALNRILYGKIVNKIIANSQETKRTVLQNTNSFIDSEKVTVIYNRFDWKYYADDENGQTKTAKNDDDESTIVLGNAGRLCEQKGQIYLLELASALKAKNIRFKLLIAGDGELKEELNKEIKGRSLEKHVELLGFMSDIKSFLSRIDIFLFPSLWEGFGFAIAEAMAMKKPVVAFDVSSNPELIIHRKTGFLVALKNMLAFEKATLELIYSSQLREEMGKQGLHLIKHKLNEQRAIDELMEVINEP